MAAQEKLRRLLLMLDMLQPPGCTLHEIADELGMSKRSAERYIHMLKEARFKCEKDKAGRYYLFEPARKGVSLNLTEEEAEFLYELVERVSGANPMAVTIRSKMYFRASIGKRAKNRFRLQVPEVIDALSHAMRMHRQVELDTYYSAVSGQPVVRRLEPLRFTENYQYLLAYEAKDDLMVNLKIDRINAVRILDEPCTRRPDAIKGVDVFHMAANHEFHDVSLLLNSLAFRLLIEEYPAAEPCISPSDNERFPFRFQATVHNFLPLGRFCLGLPGAIVVEAPDALTEYLQEKMKHYTW